LFAALDALPDRAIGRWFSGSLAATAALLAVALLVFGSSAKIAQLEGMAAAALAGGFAATFCGLKSSSAQRGLVPVYVVLAGGLAYAGAIEPESPVYALLLVPALPLAWWLLVLKRPTVASAGKAV
jgi:hypothetical protein